MAQLYEIMKQKSRYYDKNNYSTQQQYDQAVRCSSTVYVGNIGYDASQDSLHQLFSRAGNVKRIVMGINNEGLRCGFSFVIYQTHEQAERAVQYISMTRLGQKIIRVDLDPGYKEGRERGRGKDGNQKRDDYRQHKHDDSRQKHYNKFDNRRGEQRRQQRNYGKNRNRQYNDNYEDYQKRKQQNPRRMSRKQYQQKSEQY